MSAQSCTMQSMVSKIRSEEGAMQSCSRIYLPTSILILPAATPPMVTSANNINYSIYRALCDLGYGIVQRTHTEKHDRIRRVLWSQVPLRFSSHFADRSKFALSQHFDSPPIFAFQRTRCTPQLYFDMSSSRFYPSKLGSLLTDYCL